MTSSPSLPSSQKAPHSGAFAGHAHRVGRDQEAGQAQFVQAAHPIFVRRKDRRRVVGELVEGGLRETVGSHIDERLLIDDVAGRPAQEVAQKRQPRLGRAGAKHGEAIGADLSSEAGLVLVARAGFVDRYEARAAQTCGQDFLVLGAERLEPNNQQWRHLTLGDHHAHAVQQRENPLASHLSLKVQRQDPRCRCGP
jgi:hypothetical protein